MTAHHEDHHHDGHDHETASGARHPTDADPDDVDPDDVDPGEPDPDERLAEGKDPGWPIPGLAGPLRSGETAASDADAPAPG